MSEEETIPTQGEDIGIDPAEEGSDETVEQAIQRKGLTAPRIMPERIEALMRRVFYRYEQPSGTTSTFCHAYLDDAFYLGSGHSACVSRANFDAEIGNDLARHNAKKAAESRLWELEGWRLYAEMHREETLV